MEFPRTELLPRHTTGDSVGSRARPRRVQKPVVSSTRRGLGAATPLDKHARFDDTASCVPDE